MTPLLTDPRPVGGFAFDLDETLVDCGLHHAIATRRMLLDTGVAEDTVREVFTGLTGLRTRDIVESFRVASGVPHDLDDLLAARALAFREALLKQPPEMLPGARDVLAQARQLGGTALVTSGHRADAEATLEVLGIAHYFDHVITGEDVERPKPHAEPYLLAAERLGMPATDLLAFEDSAKGVRSALDARCRVIATPNVHTTRREEVADAHRVLDSLEQALPLKALVESLNRAF